MAKLFGWKQIQNAMGGLPQRVVKHLWDEDDLPLIPVKGTVVTDTKWIDQWWAQKLKQSARNRVTEALLRKTASRLTEAELQGLEMFALVAEIKRRGLAELPKERWIRFGQHKKGERLQKLLNDLKPAWNDSL